MGDGSVRKMTAEEFKKAHALAKAQEGVTIQFSE